LAKVVPKVSQKEYHQSRFELKLKSESKFNNKNKMDKNVLKPTVRHLSLGNHFVDLMSQRQFNLAIDNELFHLKHDVMRVYTFCSGGL
jgi:hypothetical protein